MGLGTEYWVQVVSIGSRRMAKWRFHSGVFDLNGSCCRLSDISIHICSLKVLASRRAGFNDYFWPGRS
jgi:hypothetical protein